MSVDSSNKPIPLALTRTFDVQSCVTVRSRNWYWAGIDPRPPTARVPWPVRYSLCCLLNSMLTAGQTSNVWLFLWSLYYEKYYDCPGSHSDDPKYVVFIVWSRSMSLPTWRTLSDKSLLIPELSRYMWFENSIIDPRLLLCRPTVLVLLDCIVYTTK